MTRITRIGGLWRDCRFLADQEGVPVEAVLASSVLLGAGLCGSRLSWLDGRRRAPQVGRPSLTVTGRNGDPPEWFERLLDFPREQQGNVRKMAESLFVKEMTPRQRRISRDHARMCGSWLMAQNTAGHDSARRERRRSADFLTEFRDIRLRRKPVVSGLGAKGVLVVIGGGEYRALESGGENREWIRRALANTGSGLTYHRFGWCGLEELDAMVAAGGSDLPSLGWIVRADALPVGDAEVSCSCNAINHLLNTSLLTRTGSEAFKYRPGEPVKRHLDAFIESLATELEAVLPEHLGIDHDGLEELPWTIQAVLMLFDRFEDDEAMEARTAELSTALARWIAIGHVNEIRRMRPVDGGDPEAAVLAALSGRLATGSRSVRGLTRSFHKIRAKEVRRLLGRLETCGIVEYEGGDQWRFRALDPGDVSALASALHEMRSESGSEPGSGTDSTDGGFGKKF